MNLFRLVFLHCLLFLVISVKAQKEECGTFTPIDFQLQKTLNPVAYNALKEDVDNRRRGLKSSSVPCISHQPILAHIIRRSNGTGGLSVSDLNAELALVNAEYASSCMGFYIAEIRYIDSDTYYDFLISEEDALHNAHTENDIINIYFANTVGQIVNGNTINYCGYAYYPGGRDIMFIKNSCASNGSTLTHELGHFFNLPHTHNDNNELVDGSNCISAGDGFCDTPADPSLNNANVNSSCQYIGTETDANGQTYQPHTRNIMSYSRKVCRDEFTAEQETETRYNFENIRNYFTSTVYANDFEANEVISCSDSLTVQFTELAVGESSYQWDFQNDGTIDDTSANPTFTYTGAGSYDVRLVVSNGVTDITTIKRGFITLGGASLPSFTDFENFSIGGDLLSFKDGWESEQAESPGVYKWLVHEGSTPSGSTGPLVDHTTGTATGKYLYTEASGGFAFQDEASIISPCIDVDANSVNPELSFFYHMYGAAILALHVDINEGGVWQNSVLTINGQQQTSHSAPWQESIIDLNPYLGSGIQIRFRAVMGYWWAGDISIDDIKVYENLPCEYVVTGNDAGGGSLREAIQCAGISSNDVQFANSMDTVFLDSPLIVNQNTSIRGIPGGNVVVSANGNFPVFDIKSGATLTVEDITLETPSGHSALLFEDITSGIIVEGEVRIKNYQ